jgi:hypothetical protein
MTRGHNCWLASPVRQKALLLIPFSTRQTVLTHVTLIGTHQPTYCHITHKTLPLYIFMYLATRDEVWFGNWIY